MTGVWGILVFPDSGFLLSLTLLPFLSGSVVVRLGPDLLLTHPLNNAVVFSNLRIVRRANRFGERGSLIANGRGP